MRGLHCGSLVLAGTGLLLSLPAVASGTNGSATSGDVAAVRAVANLQAVSRPPQPARFRFRWSHEPPLQALATGPSLSGPTVVGLGAGADPRALAADYRVTVSASDPGLRLLVVDGSGSALARLAADPRVRYAAPPVQMTLAHDRNDPLTTLVDPTTRLPYEWAFEHVGVDRALNLTQGDPSIVVGIVDSGFGQVRDLTGKVASAWYFSNEAADPFDTVGHGTFVSTIVGAANDDGYGLAGFCGACRLDIFKNVQLYDYQVAAAVRMLVDDHVRIVNLSLGSDRYSYPLADAVNYAISKGVLVVASSGNDRDSVVSFPASMLQPVGGGAGFGLAVGASDAHDQRSSFSNWGDNLSLVAPGSFDDSCDLGVWAALPIPAVEFDSGKACAREFHDPVSGEHYAYANGTSFSAPEVAGVAALVWAARPELTSTQVVQIIQQSATRPAGSGWEPEKGWGVLNAAAALELATGRSAQDSVTVSSVTAAAGARAGRRFTVSAGAVWQDGTTVAAGRIRCAVSAKGRAFRTVAHAFAGRSPRCAFNVPRWAAGAKMLVRIGLLDDEQNLGTASRSYAVRR